MYLKTWGLPVNGSSTVLRVSEEMEADWALDEQRDG